MSSIKLQPNASGTGTFTIAAPDGNTNRTLTLPDTTGTVVLDEGSGTFKIDSSGNVGIGTTPHSNSKLHVLDTSASLDDYTIHIEGYTPAVVWQDISGGPSTDFAVQVDSSAMMFRYGDASTETQLASEAMRIDSSGNLLVGKTTSTGSRFEVERTDGNNAIADFKTNNASGDVFIRSSGGYVRVRSTGTNEMAFLTAGTERMRIDSSGNLLVGATSFSAITGGATSGCALHYTGTVWGSRADASGVFNRMTSNGAAVELRRQGVTVGSISVTTTATAYNTSSDYRLKEDWQPMTGASERVLALKPVNFAWKADGSRVDGFLAHEAQEVVPEAVTGTKDEVDDEGNPKYQGIDQSKLVPLLTAALQEALAEIANLKTRLTALEAN